MIGIEQSQSRQEVSEARRASAQRVPVLRQWLSLNSGILVYLSLWTTENLWWHAAVTLSVLMLLFLKTPHPIRTLRFIAMVLFILTAFQILFSSFMRGLFLQSLDNGFFWQDWQYLLFAIERFAWPLIIVNSQRQKLMDPGFIVNMSLLLSPLKWLGVSVEKFQVMLAFILRFLPVLRAEWHRFHLFRQNFVKHLPNRSLLKRLTYWQTVLKAFIAHVIERSIQMGDMLALRGLPRIARPLINFDRALIFWVFLAIVIGGLKPLLLVIWCLMSIWLALATLAVRRSSV